MSLLLVALSIAICVSAASADAPIRAMTPPEIAASTASLQQRYFRDGPPDGYLRHRLVWIDTAALRLLLRQNYEANHSARNPDGVRFPLFPDAYATVNIEHWVDGNFGVVSVFGSFDDSVDCCLQFAAHFTDTGRFEAGFLGDETSILVSNLHDNAHYVIFEISNSGRID